jgi:hypothetical protein
MAIKVGVSGVTHLEDLYDVDTTVVQNGSILVYDSDSSLWTATFTLDGGTF